jgi:hypothetical protein
MVSESGSEKAIKSAPSRWKSFADLFTRRFRAKSEDVEASNLAPTLKLKYPKTANQIIEFISVVLREREAIVDRLQKYPDLNDHGFFMVICLMYIHTYKGIGYTRSALLSHIMNFSTTPITMDTAAKKLQRANEVDVFVYDKDRKDGRQQRYYLHPEMIDICSSMFEKMLNGAQSIQANAAGQNGEPGKATT